MTQQERDELLAKIKGAILEQTGKIPELIKTWETQIAERGAVEGQLKAAIAEVTTKNQALHGQMTALEQKFAEAQIQVTQNQKLAGKTPGEIFAESVELKAFIEGGGKGRSKDMKLKQITSLPNSAGTGIAVDRLPQIIETPLRQLTVRDLIAQGRTTSNLIEYVRELLFTNNADTVSEGALKPESDLTFEDDTSPVRTIAHWIRATRQVLSDFPQLASYINSRLTYGLKLAEENQILLGGGTGNDLHGLIPQSTDYNNGLNRTGDTFIDVLRHAMLQVELALYPPTGIVLHPTDWHNIELTKDNENRYLMANPAGNLPPMLWGLPVARSMAMPVDQFLVGALLLAATVFDREDASIAVSTEDRDNFVTNRVTILAEERLALVVFRPAAVVHGSFPADSTT